jgi:hypothetical protein
MSNGRYSASVDQLSQHLLGSAARRRDQPSTRSPALRYWNLAQQRHYRRSAPCRRAMPVSGDCAACHGPHTRGKRPGFRPRQANSRERRTVCWREMDSNHWSRHGETPFGRAMWFPRTAPPARRGTDPERDEKFESGLLRQGVSFALSQTAAQILCVPTGTDCVVARPQDSAEAEGQSRKSHRPPTKSIGAFYC